MKCFQYLKYAIKSSIGFESLLGTLMWYGDLGSPLGKYSLSRNKMTLYIKLFDKLVIFQADVRYNLLKRTIYISFYIGKIPNDPK